MTQTETEPDFAVILCNSPHAPHPKPHLSPVMSPLQVSITSQFETSVSLQPNRASSSPPILTLILQCMISCINQCSPCPNQENNDIIGDDLVFFSIYVMSFFPHMYVEMI